MNKYNVIVSVDLSYQVEATSMDEAVDNINLPDNYKQDTMEVIDVKKI